MTEIELEKDDREVFARALADTIAEETAQRLDAFEERNSPTAQKIIHEHAGPKVEVTNEVSMVPIAESIDRMTYEVSNIKVPSVHFDTEPFKELFHGLSEVLTALKEENAEARKEMAAQRELLKEMIAAFAAKPVGENKFAPNIIAPSEPSIAPAIEGLTKLVKELLQQKENKVERASSWKITHADGSESKVKRA